MVLSLGAPWWIALVAVLCVLGCCVGDIALNPAAVDVDAAITAAAATITAVADADSLRSLLFLRECSLRTSFLTVKKSPGQKNKKNGRSGRRIS